MKKPDNYEQEKKITYAVLYNIAKNCKETRYCTDCIFELEGECMFYEMSPSGWNFTWLKDNFETKGGKDN